MPLSTTHTKWIFLIIFILMVITGFYISAPYLNLHALHNHYLQINQWKDQHLLLSIVLVSLIYIIVTSLGIPGALWLTIITGFLYGIGLGLSIVLISATIGATILYIIARWLGAQWLQQKFGASLIKFEQGLQNNIWSYLFILRLLPIFPFTMINILAGLLNVRFHTFVITTFFGIIPGSFVYISLGNGLSTLFEHGKQLNVNIIFQLNIILPLLGLALLALIPIIYKKIKQ